MDTCSVAAVTVGGLSVCCGVGRRLPGTNGNADGWLRYNRTGWERPCERVGLNSPSPG